jgi:Double zinc ribbon
MGVLNRFRRSPRPAPRRALPPPGVIRRERRLLQRIREEKLRDLGGLMLEMYRRDTFREDLLADRCNELLGLDARLHELDEMLAAARHRTPAGRCLCGAPLPWGSHFCPNCGRPAGSQPVLACPECEHPLPADARFCANCGAAADVEDEAAEREALPDSAPEPAAAAAADDSVGAGLQSGSDTVSNDGAS